jgi:hypothetical protein
MTNYIDYKEFNSVGEFLAYNQDHRKTGKNRYRASEKAEDDGSSWYGTDTIAEAIELATNGWHDRPNVKGLSKQITSSTTAQINVANTYNDVCGSYVDVGAFVEGVPENMVQFADVEAPRIVRIGINLSSNCQQGVNTFKMRGAITLAIVDKLAEAGYGCELFVYTVSECAGQGIHSEKLVIKQADQHLDQDALTFWCCHPSALRRLMFANWETEKDQSKYELGVGYGFPLSLDKAPKCTQEKMQADINIDTVPRTVKDAVSYYNGLVDQINEL